MTSGFGTSLAVFRAFGTKIRGGSLWSTRIAPLAAAVLLAATTVLLVLNYRLLAGSDSVVVTALPWVVFAAAIVATAVRQNSLPENADTP